VARLISLVEDASPLLREVMAGLAPYAGHSHIIGITGSPGVALSATAAESSGADPTAAALELEGEVEYEARTGHADRVTEGDGAAVDVDLVGVPANALVDGAGLGCEGLIGFDQIKVANIPAGSLQRRTGGGNGPGTHDRGIHSCMRPRDNAGERRLPALCCLARLHQHYRRRTVVDS